MKPEAMKGKAFSIISLPLHPSAALTLPPAGAHFCAHLCKPLAAFKQQNYRNCMGTFRTM